MEYSMTRSMVLLLAVATGMTVASLYYAQPLLEAIRATLGLDVTGAGLIFTASQLGYAIGLALLVPLGDLFERRKLVVIMTLGIAAGLAGIGFSSNGSILLLLSVVVGALSAVAQILVAFSADLAGAAERGRVVGTVMSGLLLGVLLARTVAGILAQLWGWRMVFWLAAGSMMVIALAMYRGLPFRTPNVDYGYLSLLKSMPMIFIEERILRLRPEARSRLTSAYMTFFFIGGVVGSSLSVLVYAKAGWTGVCAIGAALGLLAAVIWAVERNGVKSVKS